MRDKESPVFIVGAPRTGSSFVCDALVRGAGLIGGAEGHVLPLLATLAEQISGYYKLMQHIGMLGISQNTIAHVNADTLTHSVTEIFNSHYHRIYGIGRWVDKTVNVEMIRSLPTLLDIFPEARVIYLTRNGLHNILSAMKYFGSDFGSACRNWTQCGEAWDIASRKLPAGCAVHIEHEDLIQRPTEVATSLAHHLSLPHDAQSRLLQVMVTSACAWQTATDVSIRFDDPHFDADRRRLFLKVCGEQMVRQRYWTGDELNQLRAIHTSLPLPHVSPSVAQVLLAEDPIFVTLGADRLDIAPGKHNATMVLLSHLDVAHARSLRATIGVSSPYSQGVRLEFVGLSNATGAIVLQGQYELAALENRSVELPLLHHDITSMDLLIRVSIGHTATTNDHSWAFIENMHFQQVPCNSDTNHDH